MPSGPTAMAPSLARRRKELSYDEIAQSMPVNLPLRQYMFCNPVEGGAALARCSAEVARRYQAKPIIVKAAVVRTRHHGSFEVFSPALAAAKAPAPTVTASKAAFEMAGSAPGTST